MWRPRAERALWRVMLEPRAFNAPTKTLSGGEMARVAIASAYAAERPLFLADEILPALDHKSRIAIVDLLQDLAADGYTVAIIAHQPDLKDRFHRVIEMEAGRIIGDQRNASVVHGPASP